MKHIVIVCAMGMSSSILVNRIIKHVSLNKMEILIHSTGMTDLTAFGDKADLILVGPQIRYLEETIKEKYPHIIVDTINALDYAKLNADSILERALKRM